MLNSKSFVGGESTLPSSYQENAQLGVSLIQCSSIPRFVILWYGIPVYISAFISCSPETWFLCYSHSSPEYGSSVRMECLIEGSTFPGNTKTVINNVNEIVTDKTFYVPGTNASSGKLSYFLWMNIYWCLQCKTALIIMVLHGLNLWSWSKHVYSYKVTTAHFFHL